MVDLRCHYRGEKQVEYQAEFDFLTVLFFIEPRPPDTTETTITNWEFICMSLDMILQINVEILETSSGFV